MGQKKFNIWVPTRWEGGGGSGRVGQKPTFWIFFFLTLPLVYSCFYSYLRQFLANRHGSIFIAKLKPSWFQFITVQWCSQSGLKVTQILNIHGSTKNKCWWQQQKVFILTHFLEVYFFEKILFVLFLFYKLFTFIFCYFFGGIMLILCLTMT